MKTVILILLLAISANAQKQRKQVGKELTKVIILCEKYDFSEMALILRVVRKSFELKDEENLVNYTTFYALEKIKENEKRKKDFEEESTEEDFRVPEEEEPKKEP